ncbi:type 1 glutamine amidotransferase [Amylibacter sp. SFDW26]|uniref:type 1 glutamine amidotransferase n=1 Tax=Amylibacter sp. SFDW26 TaxID=2652722 RepID=UPI001261F62F|nr:type 1 glutamine amidotransferase [Amylibacter sp. SFDW26]KAB7615471.1 type 1 glutamine amidotransferase [Amylibacter sp. SFDW26]
MRIGILQTGITPEQVSAKHGEYPDMFERFLANRGFEFDRYSIVNAVFPTSIKDADGWLITGSRHGVYEDHPWIPPLEEFIRAIYAANIPLVGVCFGHQIIAQALGGKVEKFDGGWSIGHTDYLMDGQDTPMQLNAWHQDQVVELPKDARVIGSSDFCKYAFLAYGDTVMTTQPHPEFGSDIVQGLIDHHGKGAVPKDLVTEAQSRIDSPTQAETIADMFTAIFKQSKC